ncbi:ATP-dependent DNA helicase PIF1 [Dendrobium catenatum]|uniref:ATP-dependent DNA helicase PIF1 n=1 Tax=Dendrobium catenatum TaxID=906689 RepID=A0A2I0X928_9ASPA|nr:ATP-dependent DNA helicase PIF1 [Dendrobium catenatum]
MTINKSEDQTILNVGIYLAHNVFSHGQLYVSLSRGISMSQIKLLIIPNKYAATQGSYIKNIVYKEIF